MDKAGVIPFSSLNQQIQQKDQNQVSMQLPNSICGT